MSNSTFIVTVQQHILNEQRKHSPNATGSFSWLLSGITLATKMAAARVRRAGLLDDATGATGTTNVQGEEQQQLDVYTDKALVHCLGVRENVAIIASEENEKAITFDGRSGPGKYVVLFDPLDGSSNIDVNASVGTIFSVLALPEGMTADDDPLKAVLQPGVHQLAAGYVVYGSSTILVYTTGHGVHGFTLDPLVADFHRTLLKGGIFLYPPTTDNPEGKLRLLYEANPMAFIAEQAGGIATDGERRIMEVEPTAIHQRVPLAVGGRVEMEELAEL